MDPHADRRDAKRLKRQRGMRVTNRSLKTIQQALAIRAQAEAAR